MIHHFLCDVFSYLRQFLLRDSQTDPHLIQVNVNGTEYMGSVAVNDKKKAKANAAMYCLQTMGLVPKDPDNPVWEPEKSRYDFDLFSPELVAAIESFLP